MDAERAKQIANATECSGDPNVRWVTTMHAAKVLACKCDQLESRIEQMQRDHAAEIEQLRAEIRGLEDDLNSASRTISSLSGKVADYQQMEREKRVKRRSPYDPQNAHLGMCVFCGYDGQQRERDHAAAMASLAGLVAEMRHAQIDYFRLRSPSVLQHAKLLERRVDAACREALENDQQGKLFD